jgi:hypothetical protein
MGVQQRTRAAVEGLWRTAGSANKTCDAFLTPEAVGSASSTRLSEPPAARRQHSPRQPQALLGANPDDDLGDNLLHSDCGGHAHDHMRHRVLMRHSATLLHEEASYIRRVKKLQEKLSGKFLNNAATVPVGSAEPARGRRRGE